MDFNLDSTLSVRLALVFLGATLVTLASFGAWIYAQLVKQPVADLQKRLRQYELENAELSGKELGERVKLLEERKRELELDVNTLKSTETQRSAQLARGLEELAVLVDQLKEDMRRGDIDSRVDSAEALVSSVRVAVTLAKLQSQEARDRANEQLRDALAALERLKNEQKKVSNGA